MLTRLAHLVVRRRWAVIGLWVGLTVFGVFSTTQVSDRWSGSTAVPGEPAYEAGQRSMQALGVGERTPIVVVFHAADDITGSAPVEQAMDRVAAASPGAFTSSYFATGNPVYLSQDRRTAFQMIYPAGEDGVNVLSNAKALQATAAQGLPDGTTVDVTGRLALTEATTDGAEPGAGVLVEAVVGGLGALVDPAVRVRHPAGRAHAAGRSRSPPSSTRSPWSGAVSYLTDVSAIVPFLIALIGLGLAIDYALVMLFRFRDELRDGNDVETAVVQTTDARRQVRRRLRLDRRHRAAGHDPAAAAAAARAWGSAACSSPSSRCSPR